jgi:glycosyltransferase involved in cell wall biosynthesis
MRSQLILDISRLVYAAWRRSPTGIPRVELAYAQHLARSYPDRLHFVVLDACGRVRTIPRSAAISFLNAIDRYWREDIKSNGAFVRISLRALILHLGVLIRSAAGITRLAAGFREPGIYVVLSHLHMDRPHFIEKLKTSTGLRVVYFVHDIIPIEFPEYCPPRELARDRRRMENASRLADAIIVNSQATAMAYRRVFDGKRPNEFLVIAPLGVTVAKPAREMVIGSLDQRPYFVSIGTIEPRKNHLLLLNLWRSLREELGDACPRLVLIGARGWKIANVVDMLEQSPLLRGFVEERARVSDGEMARILLGSRALLMPSFAEGYGLPLAEALTLGVPALCSDLPALREVGGDVPEYINPIDGIQWLSLIRDYAISGSPRRQAQLLRLAEWHSPSWSDHFNRFSELVDRMDDLTVDRASGDAPSGGLFDG